MNADTQQIVNDLFLYMVPMVFSLALHEWGHAASAVALGDPTPRDQGRLTLNPAAHIDPIGTLFLPIALIVMGAPVFGWAKPVMVNPIRFSRRIEMRTGMMLTAAAGPAMNLLLAAAAALVLAWGQAQGWSPDAKTLYLARAFLGVNVMLCLFNLLPVPPLDGSRVLGGLLPSGVRAGYLQLERFAPAFIGLLLVTPLSGVLIRTPADTLIRWLYSGAAFLVGLG